jgi:Ca2+-binding EF-hand superfamily protein
MRKPILAAALLGLAAPSVAQTPPAPADGTTFETWAAKARERLMALDTNHDGKISKDEFAARGAMMGGRRGEDAAPASAGGDAPKRDGSRMFDRFDANQDGFLDAAEINAVLARRFARMDANHDGVLTPDEQHAMHGPNAPEQ